MALALAFFSSDEESPIDHRAATISSLETRGEAPTVIDCVANTDQYDLAAGPLTTVALQQLLAECRAATGTVDGGSNNTDAGDRPDSQEPDSGTTATLEVTVNETAEPTPSLQADLSETGQVELQRLRDRCAAGYGLDCDRLFELAPADSDDEQFGLTCGNRPTVINCAELVPDLSQDSEADPSAEE